MRAVRFHRRGGPEVLVLEEVPDPAPAQGEVLVAVRAVALNHLDVWVRRGLPIPIAMPHVGGSDFAGEVLVLGPGASGFRPGDRVVGYPLLGFGDVSLARAGPRPDGAPVLLGEQRNGACCERLALPAENLVPLPAGLSFEDAAAVPVVFTTAWRMLAERARLEPGETLLVRSAGSGVGTAAVQIGRLLGARVLATTRTARKRDALFALGADAVLDAAAPGLPAAVRAATNGRGADVVFEHVGGDRFDEALHAAAQGGRIVVCGATAGRQVRLPLPLVFGRELSVLGATLGSRATLERVLALVAEGRLRPVIDRVLPLSECRRGHELLEAGEAFGKVVLQV